MNNFDRKLFQIPLYKAQNNKGETGLYFGYNVKKSLDGATTTKFLKHVQKT